LDPVEKLRLQAHFTAKDVNESKPSRVLSPAIAFVQGDAPTALSFAPLQQDKTA
jgi:hypothetical protein